MFFRKKPINLLPSKLDIHAHLLPNIDDGPKSMEESVALIRGFKAIGYTNLVATPHIFSQYYDNDAAKIKAHYETFLEVLKQKAIQVNVKFAAEYYLEPAFQKLLAKNELLAIKDRYILVETSLLFKDNQLHEYLFELQMKGWQPILAHPERYTYMNAKDYERLIEAGCQFQLNALSLGSYYGKEAYKKAIFLIKKGYIHYLGSDVHHQAHLAGLKHLIQQGVLAKHLAKTTLNNHLLFHENAPST